MVHTLVRPLRTVFFLTYQQQVPPTMPVPHCPRIYGFKIHKAVKENLRRQHDRAQKQLPMFSAKSAGTEEPRRSTGGREEMVVD